jgi:hypothetical protein
MTLLKEVTTKENLARAWRWIQSNPEAAYKGYFRSLYANYRIAEDTLLVSLRDRLTRGVYDPAHACKIYFPKKSSGLRPYSLLTVEDQIVYQGMVNVVAERLAPRVRARQLKEVFSHLYAGKSSNWFYRKWQNGYQEMNRAARAAFRDGYQYAATFDLTAFYDSVDHNVLRHFLTDLGCDLDFNRLLIRCLGHWTATQRKKRIYHGHGIPQGPLSSGLLAELVLQHYDSGRSHGDSVRYLRYNDDIRLFAKAEPELRWAVAELDYLSKDIGLFPQSAKIGIRKVTDIENELKTISRPPVIDLDLDAEKVNQTALHTRIHELSRNYRVSDPTEFRFLLARAEPRKKLDRRLVGVFEHEPYLYAEILRYFRRYDRLPPRIAGWVVAQLNANPIYAAVVSELLVTAEGRVGAVEAQEIDGYVKTHWNPKKHRAADLIAALGRWGIRRCVLGSGQVRWAIRQLPEWWVRSELVATIDTPNEGQVKVSELLTDKLSDPVSDVAVAAAVHLVRRGDPIALPARVHSAAGAVLEEFGLIPPGAGRVCGITRSFERLVGKKLPAMEWVTFFGKDYSSVERQAVFCYSYSAVDVTTWVNALDVFNDWFVNALTGHDPSIGLCARGKLGGFVREPTSRFAKSYPAIWRLAHEIHSKRGESHLSHAWEQNGSSYVKPTSFIPFSYLRKAKPLIFQAMNEIAMRWAALKKAS